MKKELPIEQRQELIRILKNRFNKNMHRHSGLDWEVINASLKANPDKLWSLNEMEKTGGEPDVVVFTSETDKYTFFDCATESPKERRSFCYDREALEARKKYKPKNNVVDAASAIGIQLLTEEEYRNLQKIENFDTKTSSWLKTPNAIRALGGAIFADYRFGTVFVYHNGAESYYASRGFRGSLPL